MTKIAILLGSARPTGNVKGIAAWLSSLLKAHDADLDAVEFVTLEPSTPPYPTTPVLDPTIAVKIKDPAQYESEVTRAWSKLITSCAGFVVLTPQYNWGYPGVLKNALDCIYHEWGGKPVTIISYGGHGGGKCAAQLQQVLEGALHMKALPGVEIHLPGDYIRGEARVGGGGEGDKFLDQYEDGVVKAVKGVAKLALNPPAPEKKA